MTPTLKKVLAFGMALTMTASAAVPTFAQQSNVSLIAEGVRQINKTVNEAVNFKYQEATGYWSKHLSRDGQTAYNLLLNGIANMEKKISIPEIKLSDQKEILQDIQWEHPELFYFTINKSIFSTVKANEGNYCTVQPAYDSNAKTEIQQVNAAIDKFLKNAPVNGTDYEKELYTHDYLIKHVEYASGKNNLYYSLVQGKGNCMGYSFAMKLLLNKLKVGGRVMHGSATNSRDAQHMWNVVILDGKEYMTDVTWDDTKRDAPYYAFMNLSKDEMSKTHTPTNKREWDYCTNTDQDYYKKNKLYFKSYNELVNALPRIAKGKKTFTFKMPSDAAAEDAYKRLWNSNGTGPLNRYTNTCGKSANAKNGVITVLMTAE